VRTHLIITVFITPTTNLWATAPLSRFITMVECHPILRIHSIDSTVILRLPTKQASHHRLTTIHMHPPRRLRDSIHLLSININTSTTALWDRPVVTFRATRTSLR